MLRYITPETVILLLLIELYCSGITTDTATIPILSYITSHIASKVSVKQEVSSNPTNAVPPTSLDLVLLQQLLTDKSHNPKVENAGPASSSIWDAFKSRVQKTNNFDALTVFMKGIKQVFDVNVTQIALSGTSMLGAFVRRQMLEFEKGQFSDQVKLWYEFDTYRKQLFPGLADSFTYESSFQEFLKRSDGKLMEVINNAADHVTMNGMKKTSEATTRLLEFQVEQMQSNHNVYSCSNICYSHDFRIRGEIACGVTTTSTILH